MAGVQNYSEMWNQLGIRYITEAATQSKNSLVHTIEVAKTTNIKMLLDEIKKHEKEAMCVCLQYNEGNKNESKKSPKYVCMKTMYMLCPLPDLLKNKIVCEEDSEKASMNVHPASDCRLDGRHKRLNLKQSKHLFGYNLPNTYRRRQNECSVAEDKDKRTYWERFGTAKPLRSRCWDIVDEIEKSRFQRKELTDKTQRTYCVHDIEYKKRRDRARKNRKECSSEWKMTGNRKSFPRQKQEMHHDRFQAGCDSETDDSSDSETSFNDCSGRTKRNTQHLKQHKRSPEMSETLKNKKGPTMQNNKKYDKHHKHAAQSHEDSENVKTTRKKLSKQEPTTNYNCPLMCQHFGQTHTKDSSELALCKKLENPELGRGMINIDGVDYETVIKLADGDKTNKKVPCNRIPKTFNKFVKDRCSRNNSPKRLTNSKPLGKRRDSAETVSDGKGDKCSHQRNKADQQLRNRKPLVSGRHKSNDCDCLPGFSFRLGENVEKDVLPDEECMIKQQEEQRFLRHKLGLQPPTIIMNEPSNVPLRMYDVSSFDRKKYLSTTDYVHNSSK